MNAGPARSHRALAFLYQPIDIAALAAFRILFGLLMFGGAIRFMAMGWIDQFYGTPTFFFKYWGAAWVSVPPVWAIYVHYAVIGALGLLIAVGLFYRASIIAFVFAFTWAELYDVTNYLNHYYLVTLLALLMVFLPAHRAWSVDARRKPEIKTQWVPAWTLYLLRFQIAVVYIQAGLTKLQPDWLFYAQPLNLWLSARTDTWLLGPLFDELWVAYAFSWAGFLFDTFIVAFLVWKRTRIWAYLVVVVFHALTHVLFMIGLFPFIMVIGALVFFSPSWPRRWMPEPLRLRHKSPVILSEARRLRRAKSKDPALRANGSEVEPDFRPAQTSWTRRRKIAVAAFAGYAAFQIFMPLRHYLYPGNVLWNGEGMRFAWKIMVREKHGSVTFHVGVPGKGELLVSPRDYLTTRQEREMSSRPDLILQLAHHIHDDFAARGYGDVEVRAEAWVSLNGRPPAPLIDPTVDLAGIEDGLWPKPWILPAPSGPPIQLRSLD